MGLGGLGGPFFQRKSDLWLERTVHHLNKILKIICSCYCSSHHCEWQLLHRLSKKPLNFIIISTHNAKLQTLVKY